ncbi:hypothetical protein E3Q02_02279 [Wallemia mellicola]|uniref:PAN2-PAN3 deadenylation complex catalytic subunit PAN2 n=1 Tax=Wallemia mellicola TaxID=1708541 RepID=A0AB38MW71_9BASI|nr:hypothetical protein E3Q02_02279 [Wallemia mellicola]
MAANWQSRTILPGYTTIPSSITSLSFDPYSELLWSGNSHGQVCSLYGLDGERYTSYMAHRNSPVKELCLDDRGIVTLGLNGVKGTKRSAIGKWMVEEPRSSLEAMSMSPGSSEVVAGGNQLDLLVLNTNSGSLVRKIEVPEFIRFLKPGPRSSVVCGDVSGNVQIRDTRVSKAAMQHIQPHKDGLLGIESTVGVVQLGTILFVEFTLLTCHDRFGRVVPEPLVKVYDARMMRPLPPVSFPSGPSFVKIHPRVSTSVFISDLQGQFHVTDLSTSTGTYHMLDISSYVTSMAVSTTGNHLAFGDADGSIHIWTDLEPGQPENFNAFEGIQLDWPSEVQTPPRIDWNDRTPLNSIGLPYYDTPLLSSMPLHMPLPDSSPMFNPPTPIPISVMKGLRTDIFPAHAQNPPENKGKRNLTPSRKAGRSGRNRIGGRQSDEPKFISEQIRDNLKNGGVNNRPRLESRVENLELDISDVANMPKHYRKVEIKYSKFGIEDFDFGFYNKTPYSGLETHIANSYTNALLQILHHIKPIRAVATSQTTLPDLKDNCLLTESGFLFRMLENGKGVNCQSANFSRALSSFPQAKALGILDADISGNHNAPYGNMIQSFNRFLLEQMSVESWTFQPSPQICNNGNMSPISQLLGIESLSVSMCTDGCGSRSVRKGVTHVIEFMYPRKTLSNEVPLPVDFGSILCASIIRDTLTKHVCPVTKQFVPLHSRRIVSTFDSQFPAVLSINAGVHSKENLDIWLNPARRPGESPYSPKPEYFLPFEFGIKRTSDNVQVVTDQDKYDGDMAIYSLKAVIAQIYPDHDSNHLVSIVKISDDELDDNSKSPWYIFNDFLVRNVSPVEALSFSEWKIPSVIYYERKNVDKCVNFTALNQKIDPTILCHDLSISWNRDPKLIKHQVLSEEELPKPGSLVAIDAEFVSMDREEIEFRSDGSRSVIKPSKLSLARVSVLRGEGDLDQKPFIDDYIHTSEPVVDYLTEFSGIILIHNAFTYLTLHSDGDLEPSTSRHTLVPLKAAYRKLRLLVDMGCIFIGHGLSQDFRIINLFVPRNQIIDTVALYQKKDSHRKLSLRFLSWFLLKQDIQLDTHDSIEDARAALLLYKMYKAFEKDGRLEDVLDDIYSEGRRLNWRPPANATTTTNNQISTTPTPTPYEVKIPPQQQSQAAATGSFATIPTIFPSVSQVVSSGIPSQNSFPIVQSTAPIFNNERQAHRDPWH